MSAAANDVRCERDEATDDEVNVGLRQLHVKIASFSNVSNPWPVTSLSCGNYGYELS